MPRKKKGAFEATAAALRAKHHVADATVAAAKRAVAGDYVAVLRGDLRRKQAQQARYRRAVARTDLVRKLAPGLAAKHRLSPRAVLPGARAAYGGDRWVLKPEPRLELLSVIKRKLAKIRGRYNAGLYLPFYDRPSPPPRSDRERLIVACFLGLVEEYGDYKGILADIQEALGLSGTAVYRAVSVHGRVRREPRPGGAAWRERVLKLWDGGCRDIDTLAAATQSGERADAQHALLFYRGTEYHSWRGHTGRQ